MLFYQFTFISKKSYTERKKRVLCFDQMEVSLPVNYVECAFFNVAKYFLQSILLLLLAPKIYLQCSFVYPLLATKLQMGIINPGDAAAWMVHIPLFISKCIFSDWVLH